MYKRGTGNSPLWPWGSGRQFLEVESWRSGQIPQSCLVHRRLLPSWRRRPVSCFKASHWHLCFLGSSLWWDNPMEKDAFALAPPSLSVFLKDLLTITMKKPERDWQVIYMGHFKGLRDLELPKSHVFSFWDSCSVASGINVFFPAVGRLAMQSPVNAHVTCHLCIFIPARHACFGILWHRLLAQPDRACRCREA